MNNVSAMINQMTIKERSDGRFEGRLTVNGNRKSFYGKTKSEVKNKAKEYRELPTKLKLRGFLFQRPRNLGLHKRKFRQFLSY